MLEHKPQLVWFKGDKRKLVALVIVASGCDSIAELDEIPEYCLESLPYWKGDTVNWLCYGNRLMHPIFNEWVDRPWSSRYPNAESLVKAAGLEVLCVMDASEFHSRKG